MDPNDWMKKIESTSSGIKKIEKLGERERAREFLLMGLRIKDGISVSSENILLKTGKFEKLEEIVNIESLNSFVEEEYLLWDKDKHKIYPTKKGIKVLDSILHQIII